MLWKAGSMQLIDSEGHGVELRIVGYQFPDAADLRIRRSWLVIEGSAYSPQGDWPFRWQAMTPPEAVALKQWLQRVANVLVGGERPITQLRFTEPNLALSFDTSEAEPIELSISLDLEFSPPWQRRTRAGNPYVVSCRLTGGSISAAASEWATEIEPYPG
ncbi:hypothetical protein FOH10_25670 [Nocardia otitidiscaviarum]|uniref:Uncharacterized protein n=2 Tax=Nocardia otitidiscaviarum TaxID=1823 RepID=A0A516NRR7_9NOCA|nr:hypothetical protein [Nocardia otitidiscaviarum]MCP9620812.1 hypothetical protein [Nocardia otitidiscaviarum]QDP81605.1 hypothetical protein FOH10_25670 [Nocardia otitidiscaviarum]